MGTYPNGIRVGAIYRTAEDGAIELFGYGTYDGDFDPSESVGDVSDMVKEFRWKNPRITLDSGKVVWGCECWWAPESTIRERLNGRQVREIDIDQVRAEYERDRPLLFDALNRATKKR